MIIKVRVIPNSKKTEIVSRLGSILRVKVSAPAVDEKANKMLLKFLAEFFEVKQSKVFLRRGHRGREKIIELEGKTEEELHQVLETIP
ncbi:MAG: hypothetical protein A2252_12545 [Elusimicrobia bacterium RIFOXYA2_FULL_39_19]|nr:MAG: hypothetical protein A2252_12545 [Elusimicrobia bacterium RIFOXYA2_FULL_39_19]